MTTSRTNRAAPAATPLTSRTPSTPRALRTAAAMKAAAKATEKAVSATATKAPGTTTTGAAGTTTTRAAGTTAAKAADKAAPRTTRALLAAAGLATAVQVAPVISTYGPLRRRYMPALSGSGHPGHVALTFDDGPDTKSTPHFLRILADRGLHATFFVLGEMAHRSPELLREMAAAGHEIAVHGYTHWPQLLRGPRGTYDDIARARDVVAALTGVPPRWYRPPYGIATAATHLACRRLRLSPVLWTCWGRDWTARATPRTVAGTVAADLRGGGTILLHDCDCTSVPGAWRSALGALPTVLDHCAERGWKVGPLAEHGVPGEREPARDGYAPPRCADEVSVRGLPAAG